MENNSIEKIHTSRNARRFGSIGLYGKERGELFAAWLGRGKKILEIGCRDGSLTGFFAGGNHVAGADIDNDALDLFRKNISPEVYRADLNNEWPFESEAFDAVVASEVLEHFYKPVDIISKISETIKSGGQFVGSVPNAFSLANRLRLFMAQPQKTALSDPTHVHHFSRKELKTVLKENFREVEIVPIGRFVFLDKIFPGWFSFLLAFRCRK